MIKLKHRNIPLTVRVLVFVAVAIVISLSVSSVLITNSVRHHFAEQDASALTRVANTIAQDLRDLSIRADTPQFSAPTFSQAGVLVHVETDEGDVIYHSGTADFMPVNIAATVNASISENNMSVWRANESTYRGARLFVATEQGDFYITVAMNMNFHLQFLADFRRSLLWILAGTGIATLLAAWFGIYQGHLPLRKLVNKMQQVKTSQLHLRLNPDDVPNELRELVQSFNEMVERLEDGFDRLSYFSSDIAHELRTPLSNLITQTQVTLTQYRSETAYREALYSSLEELERMAKMIGDMLWLAKSDNQQIKLELETVDLSHEISELIDFFSAVSQDENVDIQLTGKPVFVQADRSLLKRAISNLLSNAIRYTGEHKTVTISMNEDIEQDRIIINVSNPGAAINKDHLPRLFDRFYRAEPARDRHKDGAGLGLAIVRSIMLCHGGNITVHSASDMTTFTIELPRQPLT